MEHSGPDVEEDDLYSGYNNYNPTFDYEVCDKSFNHFASLNL